MFKFPYINASRVKKKKTDWSKSRVLVLYLSLPTSPCRGKKKEYSAQRGWRPSANRYHSQNHRIYKEKSETKNEAPYEEVWIEKLPHIKIQHAVQLLGGENILTYEEKYSYGAS